MTPLRNGTYWADESIGACYAEFVPRGTNLPLNAPPVAPLPVYRIPWAVRACLAVGLAVWLLAAIGVRSLLGQVEPVVHIERGGAATVVRNPSREAVAVTVELRGARAVVSPSAFALQPGESQVVRVRLREAVAAGTVLRLVTCFTPRGFDNALSNASAGAVARLYLRTCVDAKAVA